MWDHGDVVVPSYLGTRWLRWLALVSCILTVALAAGLTAASEGLAIVPPRPFENRGLAIVDGGVLWFHEGGLLLEGPHSRIRRLGVSGSLEDDFSSSASATAALVASVDEEAHFVSSVLPRRLSAIAQPPRLGGAGCTYWEPSRPYVVVEDDLVATGECQEITEHPKRLPLYIRNLRGGRWKVLRWLAGSSAPELAAEGPLLAVGAPRADRRMTVSILDLSTGATKASFETPLGQLAFASPQRIVLEIPARAASMQPRQLGRSRTVSLRLYSRGGKHFADLGSMTEPLLSGMHIATYENSTLSVRSVAGGAPRPIVGFSSPPRELQSFAFRWPDLVVSETTSMPLLASEVGCYSGSYGPASEPFLATFDLARVEPFDPPPAVVHVEPTVPLANCGPAPP